MKKFKIRYLFHWLIKYSVIAFVVVFLLGIAALVAAMIHIHFSEFLSAMSGVLLMLTMLGGIMWFYEWSNPNKEDKL